MVRRGEKDIDNKLSKARFDFKWEEVFALAIDPLKAREYRAMIKSRDEEVCSMCGEFCAMKKIKEVLKKDK